MQFTEIKMPYSIPSLSYYDQYHHDVSTSSRKMRSGEAYSKHSYRRRSDEESGEGSVENGGEARSQPLSSSSCASESPMTRLEAAQSATAPRARWVPDPVDALPWIWTPTTSAWSTCWTNWPAPSPRGGSRSCESVVRAGGKALPSPSSSNSWEWPLSSSSSALCCQTKNGSPSTWPTWPGRRRRSARSRCSRRRPSARSADSCFDGRGGGGGWGVCLSGEKLQRREGGDDCGGLGGEGGDGRRWVIVECVAPWRRLCIRREGRRVQIFLGLNCP